MSQIMVPCRQSAPVVQPISCSLKIYRFPVASDIKEHISINVNLTDFFLAYICRATVPVIVSIFQTIFCNFFVCELDFADKKCRTTSHTSECAYALHGSHVDGQHISTEHWCYFGKCCMTSISTSAI